MTSQWDSLLVSFSRQKTKKKSIKILFQMININPLKLSFTESILKRPLTVVDAFHSHLEPMEFIRPETFQDQVTFSYFLYYNFLFPTLKFE